MLLQLFLTFQFFYLFQVNCSAAENEKHISCTRRRSLILRTSLEACFCVFQVVARDDDQGANGQLSYMLSGGNDEGAFSLSSSGQLSLTQTLDREAQGKYILLITATDSGKTAGKFCAVRAADTILNCLKDDLCRPCSVMFQFVVFQNQLFMPELIPHSNR